MNLGNEHEMINLEKLLSEIEIQERVIKSYEKAVYENIGQILSLAKINLFAIDPERINDSQINIYNSRKLIGEAIHDLRYITKQLQPKDIIEKGFALAIEYELKRIKNSAACETDFSLSGTFFKFDKEKELLLFSIVQELVLDVLVMKVNKLGVKLHYSENKMEVKILHQNKEAALLTKDLIKDNIRLNNRLKIIGALLSIESLHGIEIILITISK